MTYDQLIAKVLNGKTVNARSKELGISQKTLFNWANKRTFPGCLETKQLADAAGVNYGEAMEAVAEAEAEGRPKRQFLHPALASLLIALVTFFVTPQKAEAAPLLDYSHIQQRTNLYYVKLRSFLKSKMRAFLKLAFPSATA